MTRTFPAICAVLALLLGVRTHADQALDSFADVG